MNPAKSASVVNSYNTINKYVDSVHGHLIEFFHLTEVEDDTIWENDRNKFLKSIEKKK